MNATFLLLFKSIYHHARSSGRRCVRKKGKYKKIAESIEREMKRKKKCTNKENAQISKNARERARRSALRATLQNLEGLLTTNGFLNKYSESKRRTYNKMTTKDVILEQSINGLRSMLTDIEKLQIEVSAREKWLMTYKKM